MAVSTFALPLLLLLAQSALAGSSVVKPSAGERRADLTGLGNAFTWGDLTKSELGSATSADFDNTFDPGTNNDNAAVQLVLKYNSGGGDVSYNVGEVQWASGKLGNLQATANLGVWQSTVTNDLAVTNTWPTVLAGTGSAIVFDLASFATAPVIKVQHLAGTGTAIALGTQGQTFSGNGVDQMRIIHAVTAIDGADLWLHSYTHVMKFTYSSSATMAYTGVYGVRLPGTGNDGVGDCSVGTSVALSLVWIHRAATHHDTTKVFYASEDCAAFGFFATTFAGISGGGATSNANDGALLTTKNDGDLATDVTNAAIASWKLYGVTAITIGTQWTDGTNYHHKIFISGDKFFMEVVMQSTSATAWVNPSESEHSITEYNFANTDLGAAGTVVNSKAKADITDASFHAGSIAVTYDGWTFVMTPLEAGSPIPGLLALDEEWKWVTWLCPHQVSGVDVSASGNGYGDDCKFVAAMDVHRINNEEVTGQALDIPTVQITQLKFHVIEQERVRRVHINHWTATMTLTETIQKGTITEMPDDTTVDAGTDKITLSDFTSSSLLAAYTDLVDADVGKDGTASSTITAFAVLCLTALIA